MKRENGQYYTITNPFNLTIFKIWFSNAKLSASDKILEPFAGANNIPKLIKETGIENEWVCYDIEPSASPVIDIHIQVKDTLNNFPTGFKMAITNPPYLAKNSASRRKLKYPINSSYDDLYKIALSKMLDNCDYVAAIIPESFITSNLFRERLYAFISLNCKMFNDTDCPVCLALFNKTKTSDTKMFIGDNYIGQLSGFENIQNALLQFENRHEWKFNDCGGEIGLHGIDNLETRDIYFHYGEDIDDKDVKSTSRSIVKISGLPDSVDRHKFIFICNDLLNDYRDVTEDVFLTSFKCLRRDGRYRRRLDFKIAKCILNKALWLLHFDDEQSNRLF